MSVALLVVTPGFPVEAFAPLAAELRRGGADIALVSFPCSGDSDELAAHVERAARDLPEGYVVVAHGLGATLVLRASGSLHAAAYVLMGPVLDVPPNFPASSAALAVAARPRAARLPLYDEDDAALASALLGSPLPPARCLSRSLADDAAGWLSSRELPLPLEALAAPVWIASGLLDEIAPPEVLIPAARRFPQAELVRVGLTSFDPVDYTHTSLLAEPGPVRAAARAALDRMPR